MKENGIEVKSKKKSDNLEIVEKTEKAGGIEKTEKTDSIENTEKKGGAESAVPSHKKNAGDCSKFRRLIKWWPLPAYLLLVVLMILFIMSGDKDDLYDAHYKEGTNVVSVGGTDYTILSKEQEDSYIGSFVSDKLNAVKGDKIASVRSYLLYVSVFFEIKGDPEHDYLLDGKNTVYVKKDMLEEAKGYFSDDSHINEYRMTAKLKDLDTMNVLTKEQTDMLFKLSGDEILVDDVLITENYETRREIYGFYDDGLFYKAVMELFKYNNEIYKTTMMIDGDDNQGKSVLKGIKLPDEYQQQFLSIWN